jgi:hypothetical protein
MASLMHEPDQISFVSGYLRGHAPVNNRKNTGLPTQGPEKKREIAEAVSKEQEITGT